VPKKTTSGAGLPVRYLNPGAYIAGVPRCDMDAQRWAEVPADLRALAVASGLYAVDEAALAAAGAAPEPAQDVAQVDAQGECEGCQQ
jgi:hypothetical protein